MQTLISTSCVLAQWNDLPETTWQDMNSPVPPPVSCSLLIRRRCAGVLVAGLSIPTLFPTSYVSIPLPRAAVIAMCGGLRNMYATTQAWRTGHHSGHHFRWWNEGVGQNEGAGVVHIPRQQTILTGWLSDLAPCAPNIFPAPKLSHITFMVGNCLFGHYMKAKIKSGKGTCYGYPKEIQLQKYSSFC